MSCGNWHSAAPALITLSEIGKAKSRTSLSAELIKTINPINPHVEKHEKIEKIIVMKEDWNVDNGLETPTMKAMGQNL
ncbi:hypothetical protein [Flavobacterium sp. W20_MBD1_R3]|uniref:hypothetical protein n=1 Tax=Flavobacterium sp. W20_MBD1_R3 TaxID=3240278 RepID=UPI003F92BDCD